MWARAQTLPPGLDPAKDLVPRLVARIVVYVADSKAEAKVVNVRGLQCS